MRTRLAHSRCQLIWRRLSLPCCAALALGCLHAKPAAQADPLPRPDAAAMREAQAEPGQQGAEPPRYVSARAYQHTIAALLARQDDDLPSAAAELREALLYDPESAHLHTLLADVLLRQGRLIDAEEELHAALASEPAHAPALVLSARTALAHERPTEARSQLRAAITAAPEEPEAYRELGRLEIAQGDLAATAALAEELTRSALRAQKRAADEQREEDDEPGAAGQGRFAWVADRLREQSAEAWVDLARALAGRHEDDGAGKAFERAEQIDPADTDALAAHAQFLESRRRWAPARELTLRVLAQRPESPDVLAALSRLSLEEGDPESAQAHAHKLLALAREVPAPAATASRSAADGEAKDLRDGREEERRELVAALFRVAVPLLGVRRSAEAQAALEGALRLFPAHPELEFYRALALAQRGRAREAAQAFEQVMKQLARKPDGPPPQSLLGVDTETLLLDVRVQEALARGKAGDTGEALKRLRALFAEHPLEEGVALALLEGFDRAGKTAEAVALMQATARLHAGSDALLFALGNALDRVGKRDEAQVAMRRVLELSPQHAGALNYVGYTLTEGGSPAQLAEAFELLTRAVEERPDDGAIADSFGYCLFKRGQPARALVELKRADGLSPDDPVILSHLGDALLASGQADEAGRAFLRALARLSNTAPLVQKRGKSASSSASASPPPGVAAAAAPGGEIDPSDRTPEPGDARVREELEAKLRSLTAR